MPFLRLLLAAAAWFDLLFWSVRATLMLATRRRISRLADAAPADGSPDRPLPRLAVIVPALNEEAGIRAALESLAAQDYPDLLVIPIDDRSTDRTGEIMDEVAARMPRIDPIHVRELPADWLGKNHANWVGSQRAKERGAEWLLFTDGDVQYSPGALRKAMGHVGARRLDHLAVGPEMIVRGFGESLFVTTFLVWFLTRYQVWAIEDARSKQFMGIGAFNLVRREAYERVGTHAALALTVADDMALGKLIKEAGFRQAFAEGAGEVRVRWQPGFAATVRGLYKNSFASLDFDWFRTLGSAGMVFVLNVLVFALPWLTSGTTRIAAGLGLALAAFVFAWAARERGRPWNEALGAGLCAGFGGLLFAWTMIASAVVTTRQGGVVWRGTLYPIRLLKGRQVRL